MPKHTSSASSATKKKHARRAAVREEEATKDEDQEAQEDSGEAREQKQEKAKEQEQEQNQNQQNKKVDERIAYSTRQKQDTDIEDGVQNKIEDGKSITDPIALDGSKNISATYTQNQGTAVIPSLAPPPLSQLPKDSRGKTVKESLPAQKGQRGQKNMKQTKKHRKGEAPPPPRKKQYIPPPKPPRGQMDPVDIYGLGVTGTGYERISPDKVVTLRLLNKKDSNSIERALDQLNAWISSMSDEQSYEELQQVEEFLPVWVSTGPVLTHLQKSKSFLSDILDQTHHLPRLSSHVSRRVRHITASLHATLLHGGSQALIGLTLPLLTSPTLLREPGYLSSQLCSAFDLDRQVRALASKSWQVLLGHFMLETYLQEITNSLNESIFESHGKAISDAGKTAKLDDESRLDLLEEQDQKNSHLASCIDAIAYLLDRVSLDTMSFFEHIVSSDHFWSFLSPEVVEAAHVRRATWGCLKALATVDSASTILEDNLNPISRAALGSAFIERDFGTQTAMWGALLSLLRKFPQSWLLAENLEVDQSFSESEEGDSLLHQTNGSSHGQGYTFARFLELLQLGGQANAVVAYQTLPLLLSTLPEEIFPLTPDNLNLFFTSFWAAFTGRALEAAGSLGFIAYTSALADVLLLYGERATALPDQADPINQVLVEQSLTLWEFYLGVLPQPSKISSLSRPATVDHLMRVLIGMQDMDIDLSLFWTRMGKTALLSFDTKSDSSCLPLLADAISLLVDCPNAVVQDYAFQMEISAISEALTKVDRLEICTFLASLLEKNTSLVLAHDDLREVSQHTIRICVHFPKNRGLTHRILMTPCIKYRLRVSYSLECI